MPTYGGTAPYIHPFWSSILYWIEVIQGYPIPNDPWVVLFHCTGEPVIQYSDKHQLY